MASAGNDRLKVIHIAGVLYNLQDKLLYYPEEPAHSRIYVELPQGLSYENIFTHTSDGVQINMVLIKQPQGRFGTAPTMVFFHGNAGNIGHRMMNAHCLYLYSGFNILLVEYRGYGKSQGSPSEEGLYLDALAAMKYIFQREDIDHSKIVVFGRSLGGAVAIYVSTHPHYSRKIFAVILENTFTSLPQVAKALFHLGFLQRLPNWSFKNQYPSVIRIRQLQLPTLFLSGQSDNLVPPAMMNELYDKSGSILKRLVKFQGASHNETWQSNGYYDAINNFMMEVYKSKVVRSSADTRLELGDGQGDHVEGEVKVI
ncbi:protein ABHD13-like [Lingula anatina]|uniref:Protein ABHD13 n=1 Tax=Lingula anatina TaxID=7574 RepID=A0A1S3K2X4_LINAN|nr:protein ABHD13-like [Lingula anatina]|eukprot:XP_013416983.1 protein ABHD13-like [Lingula anatina]